MYVCTYSSYETIRLPGREGSIRESGKDSFLRWVWHLLILQEKGRLEKVANKTFRPCRKKSLEISMTASLITQDLVLIFIQDCSGFTQCSFLFLSAAHTPRKCEVLLELSSVWARDKCESKARVLKTATLESGVGGLVSVYCSRSDLKC